MNLDKNDKIELIGDTINKNWIKFLDENKNFLLSELDELDSEPEDMDYFSDLPNMYISIEKATLEIGYEQIMFSDYFTGISPNEYWLAAFRVSKDMSIDELKEIELAEESFFFEDLI